MKNKRYLLTLAFLGLGLFAGQASALTTPHCGIFNDVAANDKNCDAIKYVYERNIFSGYNLSKYQDGTAEFRPNQAIIRAEVLKVAIEAFTIMDIDPKDKLITGNSFVFTDLKGWSNQWWFKFDQQFNWSYVGSTSNFEQRHKDHGYGKVKSTKGLRPLEIVYTEAQLTRESAYQRELYLKSGSGREERYRIIEEWRQKQSGIV